MLCFIIAIILILPSTYYSSSAEDKEQRYIFFLHNKFLELFDIETPHEEYGKVEYNQILQSFRNDGFIVFSEKRQKDTDMKIYSSRIINQVDSLLHEGVPANHITIIGTSKGGYIAQYISTYLANPNLNFVFIGAYQDTDIKEYPDINFCGNILTIFDKSDPLGVSAQKRKETSKLAINHFKEIELDLHLKHGFLYKALDAWIKPCKQWAKGNYNLH